jgi:hypothetical protein
VELERLDVEAERSRGGQRGLELVPGRGLPQDRHAARPRQCLLQQFYSLPGQFDLLPDNAGDVARGRGKTRNVSERDRVIVDGHHDDGKGGTRRLPRSTRRRLGAGRYEQGDVETDQFGGQAGQPL